MFVAFSCKQRCTCPSYNQKRTLRTAIHVAEDICAPVAHRQVVRTIPKRLRLHTRFDRNGNCRGRAAVAFRNGTEPVRYSSAESIIVMRRKLKDIRPVVT